MKAKKLGRIIIFMLEIVVILVMTIVVIRSFKTTPEVGEEDNPGQQAMIDPNTGEVIQTNKEGEVYLPDKDWRDLIPVNPELDDDANPKQYWNIALFGVDARNPQELFKGSRSDSMMIASVNKNTGEIKLVSVYRDTYLNTGNDKYRKCNAAYSAGGAEQAINMLNSNLDLNIEDFITVNYQAVIDTVDGVGGVWIDVDSEEIRHINNYQETISKDTMGGKSFVPVTETGYQLLNGLQATAYCRIRYTKGDDFKRAERQREVIKAIQEQAQKLDLVSLTNIFNKVAPSLYTSIEPKDILALLGKITDYRIVDEGGFPNENMRTTGTIGAKGSCVIPLDLASNVTWLHKFLYGMDDYEPTNDVKKYSDVIKADTRQYIQ